MTVLHDNLGNPIDAKNPLPVDVSTSDAIVPTDIQSHLQTTIQTHNAVSVAASGFSSSAWVDTDGFDKIVVNLKNDASGISSSAYIYWSIDGSTPAGYDDTTKVIPSSTTSVKSGIVDTKSRYAQIVVSNGDTIAHTMSSWVYLKS